MSVQDVDWKIDDNTVLRPDLAIVCLPLVNDYIVNPPTLIVEILSPSSGHRDRVIKHEIYEAQGVRYYIIANPLSATYTVYQLIDNKYQEYTTNTFEIHADCIIKIDIAKVLEEAVK